MKRSREELLEDVRAYIGDDTSDAAVTLIENVSDSYEEPGEDWKAKYEELDASWRQKYLDRFSSGDQAPPKEEAPEEAEGGEEEISLATSYDELFKEED